MRDRRRSHRAIVAAVGTIALAAGIAPAASAMTLAPGWRIVNGPGDHVVTIEPGTTALETVAVGGRGGGATGGRGAVVAATLPVTAGQRIVMVLGDPAPPALDPTHGGAGGGAAMLTVCAAPDSCGAPTLIAAGGGGSGAGTALLPGGAGGDAGQPGRDGAAGVTPVTLGADGGGGAAGTATGGGAGGAAGGVPAGCPGGTAGPDGHDGGPLSGGAGGGLTAAPGRGGGGGGWGLFGGGGGGSAALCETTVAGGAGGGGGGFSVVPAGGQLSLNDMPGPPSIRWRLVTETTAPTVVIAVPAQGAAYKRGAAVTARYACSDEGAGIASCAGPVASGAAIDTATAGEQTFTVVARDRLGNVASRTVSYVVRAAAPRPPARPRVTRLVASAARFRFTLAAPARVTLRIQRRVTGRRPRAARWVTVGTLTHSGRAGRNTVRWNGRVGAKRLRAGRYRVVVRALAGARAPKLAASTFAIRRPARARR